MNKKGNHFSTIITIIMVIVSFLLILALVNSLSSSSKQTSEGLVCYTTLGMQDIGKQASFDTIDLQNACKTIPHTLKVGKGDEKQVLRYLADKMARTWWMVHEGTIEDTWNSDQWFKGTNCKIVYAITLKEKKNLFRKNNSISIPRDNFLQYLTDTIYPPKKAEDKTYLNYFTENKNVLVGALPDRVPEFTEKHDETTIHTGETYAILLLNKDPGSGLKEVLYTIGAGVATIATGFVGGLIVATIYEISETEATPANQLYLTTMDYAEQNLGCDYMQ